MIYSYYFFFFENFTIGIFFKAIGAIFVEELDEIEDKSRPVIFSAHGVPKTIPEQADNYKMEYISMPPAHLYQKFIEKQKIFIRQGII